MVGSLGVIRFDTGIYAYVGRAFGPGGLAARLAHHLRPVVSAHWHIDYLRSRGTVREIWYSQSAPSWEHRWARALSQMRGAVVPADGFGSSDCQCRSHLLKFNRAPRKESFRRQLRRLAAESIAPIHRLKCNDA